MHTFETTTYGFKFSISGFFSLEAAQKWCDDYLGMLEKTVKSGRKKFGQFADLRGFKPGPPEAQKYITDTMKKFKEAGGERSIVLFDSPLAAMQIRRLAKEADIYQWERYIDSQTHPDFDNIVIDWLVKGLDPD